MSELTIKKNYFNYLYNEIDKEKQLIEKERIEAEEKDEENSNSRITKQD